jgi:starch-binding outer membrane protein, SusD/RagB family
MRFRHALPAIAIVIAAGCDDTLSLEPVNEVPAETAIVDAASAHAALLGAYDALQEDDGYYGGNFFFYGDLGSDIVDHTGTFDTYLEVDRHQTTADNGDVEEMYEDIYMGIHRVNVVIQKVPTITDLGETERDQILGEAHFLRALHYHNLVKYFGGVALRLEPPTSIDQSGEISRATVDETYAQILTDLDQAAQLITEDNGATRASRGAVWALRSRVLLYREQWAQVLEAADSAESYGYALASSYSDLFTPEGSSTPEDIFRLPFTATEFTNAGYYYGPDGRYEVAPSCSLVQAYDPAYECGSDDYNPTDDRGAWNVQIFDGYPYGTKYPTAIGAEDMHVIRLAEVILNRAEALARTGQLAEAISEINRLRERANATPYTLAGVASDPAVPNDQEVLEAIWNERVLELAMEGDRWPDLVRTGRAVEVLGLTPDEEHTLLFPIPQNETDVSPNVEQNPGY